MQEKDPQTDRKEDGFSNTGLRDLLKDVIKEENGKGRLAWDGGIALKKEM